MAEVVSPDYPGERLMVGRNPLLATERRHHRQDLLAATEALLAPIAAATKLEKWRLKGAARIGVRVGKVINKFKVVKHFRWWIDAAGIFPYQRNADEACLDGFYVLRTNLPAQTLDGAATVTASKQLSRVARAFRRLKTVDLKVRPVFHRTEVRVRAPVFLCLLAYYVEWHLKQKLQPLLFDEAEPDSQHSSVVAPSEASPAAQMKAQTKRTADGEPVHSFQTLLTALVSRKCQIAGYWYPVHCKRWVLCDRLLFRRGIDLRSNK